MKTYFYLAAASLLMSSCAAHKKSNIKTNEDFVVELSNTKTDPNRGISSTIASMAIEGVFMGAKYLADESAKSLTSSYTKSISLNDYYNDDLGYIEKTYKTIHVKKYANPKNDEQKLEVTNILKEEIEAQPKTRGNENAFVFDNFVRKKDNKEEDLLNFHAVIELISDENNPAVTKLSFNDLRIFFSKTKVFSDEDLNVKVSISIEGQWRNTDGSPMKAVLIEQEYDFKKIEYGLDNQISSPIVSPWYYDIPAIKPTDDSDRFGIVKINIQMQEYEGNKSEYINKLPSILDDNKNSIIQNGTSQIEKIIE